MNNNLENIKKTIEQSDNLNESEKEILLNSIKPIDKEIAILEFKLQRTEKVKRTTSVLLEETIDELEKKRQAIEEQNRDLEIEAALERVRSRTMGMQNSNELADTAVELSNQLRNLNLLPNNSRVFFSLIDTETDLAEVWMTQTDGTFRKGSHQIPLKVDKELARLYRLWKENKPLVIRDLKGEKLKNYYEFLKSLPHVPREEGFRKILDNPPERIILTEATHQYGTIGVTSFELLPAEAQNILIRFSKVFSQIYTRFLDLKKAEAQAREAQIEAALEKVRSRSLAMQTANELGDVVIVIVEKLKDLGVVLDANGVILCTYFKDSKNVLHWIASPNFSFAGSYLLPYFDHPIFKAAWESKESGADYFSKAFSKEEKDSFFEYAFEHSDYKNFPDKFKKWVFQNDKHSLSFAWQKNSAILIPSHTGVVPSESDVAILKRFAKVFEQAYVRFLDLQKAEAQAREAQIEAALEKVRSRSLAMQKSDELQNVVSVVFEQLQNLDFALDGAAFIATHVKDYDGLDFWMEDKITKPACFRLPYYDAPSINDIYDALESGKDFISNIYGKEKNIWFEYAFEHTDLKIVPEDRKKWIIEQEYLTQAFAVQKNSALGIHVHHKKNITENEIDILKRFSQVFEQGYVRFLDLQKAEVQAREAVKQSSLDRVRGEIASMRNSKDLNRITPVIWRELQALEVPFIRCGVFILDEANEKVRVFLTTPEGKALGVLNLAFDTNKIIINIIGHWRKKQIFKTHWDKEEFINWTKSMMEMGQVQNAETYQGSATAPESLHLHFIPFKQGMLYVGNVSSLTDEKLELVKTIAEAFSIAYARYEDFKNLEEAKNQIEVTLNELKATQSQLIQSEKMASLGELTAGIAHEIQNPLNFVNNFSELNSEMIDELNEELDNGDIEEAKAISKDIKENELKITHHGKRAESIVKGMLLHSRGSSGKKEPTDINALCDEFLRLSYHGFRAKDKSFNADYKLELDESLPKIEVVPEDIGRVLLNLINNAFYAAPLPPEGGFKDPNYIHKPTVIVKTSYLPPLGGMRGATITVSDNGPGIPPEIKEKIFQPFFTTKSTGEGTGLGLSLSYDIVKAHGGQIKVESTPNSGSEFIIHLPLNSTK